VPLLTEEEIAEIRRRLADGLRGGPVLLKWIEQLLEDRASRIRMLRAPVGWPSKPRPDAREARPEDTVFELQLR
jgi:hypothetical protein